MSSNPKKKRDIRLTAARIEPVTKLFAGERASIELCTRSALSSCRAVWKQLTCINETEARAVSCDVIMVTSHFESFGSILGHFPTFATPNALYQWSCLGLPYRAVGCILYRSVTPCRLNNYSVNNCFQQCTIQPHLMIFLVYRLIVAFASFYGIFFALFLCLHILIAFSTAMAQM